MTTTLIQVDRDLVTTDDITIKEIEEVNQQISVISSWVDEKTSLIENTVSEMEHENQSIMKTIRDIEREIALLEPTPDIADKESVSPLDEVDIQNTAHDSELIKRIFRDISMICHPDKTDDKEKHRMFMDAKTLKLMGDLYGLMAILGFLKSGGAYIKTKVDYAAQLRASTEKLLSIQASATRIRLSTIYIVVSSVTSKDERTQALGRSQFSRLLAHRLDAARSRLAELKPTYFDKYEFHVDIN